MYYVNVYIDESINRNIILALFHTMDYFKSIQAHMSGNMDIDAVTALNSESLLISLGSDDLVTWRNLSNDQSSNLQLQPEHGFTKIALHPLGTKFLLGGPCKKVVEYSTASKQVVEKVCEPLGAVTDVKYSPSGRYIGVASEQLRLMIFDMQNSRKMKCRPGHQNKIYNAFFSSKDRFVASIGEDSMVLIYEIYPDKDPQQVFRTKFTNQTVSPAVQGCFVDLKEGYRVYVPGALSLQIIEQLANRWEIKKSNIAHTSNILIAQTISPQALATSCKKDLCIWSVATQQKLIVLEQAPLAKIIPIFNSFIGHRNDGLVYVYNKPLPAQLHEPIEQIQAEENESRIQFENEGDENIELEYDQDKEEEQLDYEKQVQILSTKKKVADKIIKVFPQGQLTRETSFFDQNRFLFMNLYGYVYETRQVDDITVYAQFNRKNDKQPATKVLFKNKEVKYFDMNSQAVCYANLNQYGLKIDNFSSWEKDWFDIQAVALSGNWMAVANFSQIRFVDIAGNLIKSVCFDRPILIMQAYENLLAVVYHESIPMYESQLLAMRIFNVNQFSVAELNDCHVPLTVPEFGVKGCALRWFGFSKEGMIFSQDTFGMVRAYSLQTNQWTPLVMEALADPKKAWIIGFEKGQMVYWRITDVEPQPTVRPRLTPKNSLLMLSTLQEQGIQQLRTIPISLWKRYCLDHELARWRLWGRHKMARNQKHINYELSANILDEKKISDEHLKLDVVLFNVIKYYIKSQQLPKALGFIKSHIRSIQAGKDLIQMLDSCNHRNEAVDLQYFYDQKQREIEYESIQELALKDLRTKAEVSIRAKKQNPMNPKVKKQVNNPISYHISSQQSQASSIMQDITHKSQQSSKMDKMIDNPFLKKKSTHDRKQEIEEHIEKYGVKRKAEEKKGKH